MPSIHKDEYVYARLMTEEVLPEEVEYSGDMAIYNARKGREWQEKHDDYMKKLVSLEERYGLIASDFRKKHRLGERHMDPFSAARSRAPGPGTTERENWEKNMHESLQNLGSPPSRPLLRGTPFVLALELKDKEDAAFLFRHHALVNSFLAGSKGWHIRFFGKKFEAFKGHFPELVDLEEVRKTFLFSHKWVGGSRASLPTPEYFVERYTSMYPY